MLSVRWVKDESISDQDARALARAAVSVLLGQPQPKLGVPRVLRTMSARTSETSSLAQVEEPITYQELREQFVFAGLDAVGGTFSKTRTPQRQIVTTAFSAAKRKTHPAGLLRHRVIGVQATEPRKKRRPGKGGRQYRPQAFSETTATAELHEELGQPVVDRIRGISLMQWDVDPNGDGLMLGRLSGQELQGGETVMGQVHAMRRTLDYLKRTPRYLLVSTNNSAGARFEHRPDLLFMEHLIAHGEITWVAVRDFTRIARREITYATTFELLEETETDLIIAEWNRAVDWQKDKPHLRSLGSFAEMEREATARRTQTGVVNQLLGEGKGWAGSVRFGFVRDKYTKEIRVDPEQWPFVKMIHYRYADLGGGYGGLRKLADELEEQGCKFSHSHLRNILTDVIYVTGEWITTWRGMRVAQKPIMLPEPIPLDVYQRNQEFLEANRSRASENNQGQYVLNAIPVYHARCEHEQVPNGKKTDQGEPKLTRPRLSKHGENALPAYRHTPRSPDCCRGWVIDQATIEPPFIEALYNLARNAVLQREWKACKPGQPIQATPVLSKAQRGDLERQAGILRSRIELLEDDYAEKMMQEGDVQAIRAAYMSERAPLDKALQRLERKLEVADKVPPRRVISGISEDQRFQRIADAAGIEIDDESLLGAMKAILTPLPPEDLDLRIRRQSVVKACVSKLIVHDVDGGVELEIFGPLVPESEQSARTDIIRAARPALVNHLVETTGRESTAQPEGALPEEGAQHASDAEGDEAHKPGLFTRPGHIAQTEETGSAEQPIPYTEVSAIYYSPGAPAPRARKRGQEPMVSQSLTRIFIPCSTSSYPKSDFDIACESLRRLRRSLGDTQLTLDLYAASVSEHPGLAPVDVIEGVRRQFDLEWEVLVAVACGDPIEIPDERLARLQAFDHLIPVRALRMARDAGRLRSVLIKHVAYTSKEWVLSYMASRDPIGRASTAGRERAKARAPVV